MKLFHKVRTKELTEGQFAFLLNMPAAALVLFILLFPLVSSFSLSLHKVGLSELRTGTMAFVGLKNFINCFSDPFFWTSLKNTFIFSGISLSLMLSAGLVIALIINETTKLSIITRNIILFPWAIPPIVSGLLWSFMYHPKFGYFNVVLYKIGIIHSFISWTGKEGLALYSVIFAYTWRTIPFCAILFYAALQGIPRGLYEAAEIDGANAWQRFKLITLPLLKPTILVLLLLRTIMAFSVFDEIVALTQGGPGNSTWVMAWYIYSYAFRYFKFGIAAAAAYIMTVCIALLAIGYIKFLYTDIEY